MDLEIVGRRGNAIIVAVSFDLTKARPFGLAFLRWYQNFFLAYMNRFVDGRELKGKTAAIGEKINSLLDNLTMNDFHSVHYHYDKEADLVGDYTALSLSTIYYE